jgi:hypothetical protein
MKKSVSFIVLSVFALAVSAQINVATNGNVGVKTTTPGYTFDVNGTARINCGTGAYYTLIFENTIVDAIYTHPTIRPSSDWYGSLGTSTRKFGKIYSDQVSSRSYVTLSDERIKENIKPLSNSLEKIIKLKGVSYDFKSSYFNVEDSMLKNKLKEESKNQIGFLAQELKEIFPETVYFDSTSNLYSIGYSQLIPVLVEAMKEQQAQIEELKKQVADLAKSDKN